VTPDHPAIDPTPESLARFHQDLPSGQPIVMLNLLRFRAEAAYRPKDLQPPCSGRAAYAEYSRHVLPMLAAVGGKPVFLGRARCALVAPEGEDWDEVLLVQYPSKEAFLQMVGSAAYRAVVHHRTAALADSRLVATLPAA
jgi:uncharacterized protein (DUF1330 family)